MKMFRKFIFIASLLDKAGMNIKEELEKLDNNLSIFTTDRKIVDAEDIDKQLEKQGKDFDFIIFISKHRSEIPNKTLSIHAPGNWKKAELGGRQEQICPSSAFFLKHLFIELNKQNQVAREKGESDYICTLECTHHGPYIEKPCCFIEIGSNEAEWADKKAGKIVALTLIKAIENWNKNNNEITKKWVPCVGLGGPHYCPNLNKVQLNSQYAFCHVIPQYALPLNEQMLYEVMGKTVEKTKLFILDWKGLGKSEQRQGTINLLNQLNLEHIRTSKIEK